MEGTGRFASSLISGPPCGPRRPRKGQRGYYHQLVAAVRVHRDQKPVLPLVPEASTPQEGASKNAGEWNASRRWVKPLREAFPDGPIRVVEESLFANGPPLNLLEELNRGYIISVKPAGQESLFAAVKDRFFKQETEEFEGWGDDKIVRGYRWMNAIPLNTSYPDLRVNFLAYWESGDGKEFNFSWITAMQWTQSNVECVMKGGRRRWPIENQTFNTLKHQDDEFDHHFGPGKQDLATVWALWMRWAFRMDQGQE